MPDPAKLHYVIRAALTTDAEEVYALSAHLNTVNLPHDRAEIEAVLQQSEASFSGAIHSPARRRYMFVLEERPTKRIVGTSMLIGQLGTRDAPYIYLGVQREERYSDTLDRHFTHTLLRIHYVYSGPTEIGALVVHPDFRRRPDKLGTSLSYVRFLFVASRRADFRDEIVAELLPPLSTDGTSHLWEALGRHFTGLDYREADRLSKRNKEFIRGLFPRGDIYATLLSRDAQEVIGKVGPETVGVERMLRRIGFRYAERIDPFDGGPHFIATTDEIAPVQRARACTLNVAPTPTLVDAKPALLARVHAEPPYFEAFHAAAQPGEGGLVTIAGETAEQWSSLAPGNSVWFLPLQ